MKASTQLSALEWFVDFINLDLSTVSPSGIMKLTADAITINGGMGPWLFGKDKDKLMPLQRWSESVSIETVLIDWNQDNKLKACQERLQEFFHSFMNSRKDALERVSGVQKPMSELNNFFLLAQTALSSLNIRVETPIIPYQDIKEKDDILTARVSEEDLLTSKINIAFRADSDEDTLLFYFCMTLWLFPLNSIRSCQECGKHYVHVHKSEKIYCSARCGVRKANRDRRERIKKTDPEKYLKDRIEGKKRASISYKKRISKKLGKNVKVGK